ncbi:alpha/beta fold hydrolase [Aquabacterium sp.]|uniref:PHA/PHB synthase family protein n=1 Tax=Aquabacterium sp. TaxID=1872578 RepID=UPI0025BE2950|nr:alpha/beta fold hydrolase [Aquabacterium sp.]
MNALTAPDPVWQDWVQQLDRHAHARIGELTGGISPIQAALVYLDWLGHLSISPGKQLDVLRHFFEDLQATAEAPAPAATERPDPRFAAPAWQTFPFNAWAQGFQILERTWEQATRGVPGMSHKSQDTAAFAARQWLDIFAPSNLPWLNPEVLRQTAEEGGANLLRGGANWFDDWQRQTRGLPPAGVEAFKVGRNVAITPGKVVLRNDLMELIQYSPATEQVHAEPILIVPAWIMKYYILDLSPHNSLVKYLVEQGHTVFMVSWKNPTALDRNKGMDAYREEGVMAALDAVNRIVPDRKVHGVGYCLGGTMLLIAAATMGRAKDERFASLSLFAAQGDFSEAGELLLFINDSEVDLIEAMMAEEGVLKGSQMAGTFQLLHSNDLIWSRVLKEYQLGHRDAPNDLMAWNADTTRMPYRMHSEYLHKLFLHNELASGRYEVDGAPIWFTDIHQPTFAVGTVTDHVAPWKSVYKLHLLPLDLTFVLTSGGHNAGIVSEPGHPRRHFQIQHREAGAPYTPPDTWQAQTPHSEGSWWPSWHQWLVGHSSGLVPPPRMGLPDSSPARLDDAPGHYVLQR